MEGASLTQEELKANLNLLIQHTAQDGVLHRFHSLRPLQSDSNADNFTFLMTLSTRAAGEVVHQAILKLQDLSAMQLIGARIRPGRLKTSPLAEDIRKLLR